MTTNPLTQNLGEKITTGEQYRLSLRERKKKVYMMGERIKEPADHPMIRPSIIAMAKTYDLALEEPDLASVISPLTGEGINRFLYIAMNADEVVQQNLMQR